MKTYNIKTATKTFAFAALVAGAGLSSHADITTGWRSVTTTSSVTSQFFDKENWYGGVINGYFGADVNIAKTYSVVLNDDWEGSFQIYGGPLYSDASLVFLSDSATGPHTVLIDDNLDFLSNATKGTVCFGKLDSAKECLNFDLGNAQRTITMRSGNAPYYYFFGQISNGSLVLGGGGGVFALRQNGYTTCDVIVKTNVTLEVSRAGTSQQRVGDLTLRHSTFSIKEGTADTVQTIGTLRVDGSEGRGGLGVVSIASNGKVTELRPRNLELQNGGVLAVVADNLGGTEDAAVSKITFSEGVSTIGDIVPGVIVGQSATIGADYNQSLAVYDPTRGLRALTTDDSASAVAEDPVHLRVTSQTTLALTGEETVKSLFLEGGDSTSADTVISGTDPLTVTSGQVYLQYNRNKQPVLDVPLAFGDVTGYFYYGAGKNSSLKAAVSGSKGLVFVAPDKLVTATSLGSLNCSDNATNSTYTGDTYIQSALGVGNTQFLPHGERTGDVYVNGTLSGHWEKIGTPTFTINGLYGTGEVKGPYSSSHYFALGDNDADGDFAGIISVQQTQKIGKGTQRFSGMITGNGSPALDVKDGAVILDGTVTRGAVNVAAGAALGGSGGITNNLVFASGAKLAVTVVDDVASCLTVAGTVSGGPVTVNANVKSGKWRTAQCILKSDAEITATFSRGAGVGALELRNNGTELWASPKVSGFTIIIR